MLNTIQLILGDSFEEFDEERFDALHDIINAYKVFYPEARAKVNIKSQITRLINKAFEVEV